LGGAMKLELIGTGNTAQVYNWEENKVLKLFYEGYPTSAVEKEYTNALLVKEMDFSKPIVYEIIMYEGRQGIIYEKIYGETLLDWFFKTGDLDNCALYMSVLHKRLLKLQQNNLPGYKEFLEYHIRNSGKLETLEKEKVLCILKGLPEGNTLCHGDFYPGNILMCGTENYVIDFMNLCKGNYLYDIARTVYLVGYTPVSEEEPNREYILNAKRILTETYLSYMGVTLETIRDYLTVIKAARGSECPNE